MEQTTQQPTVTWDEYYRKMSSLAAEMIGAAKYFEAHPEWATDEHVADAFRKYAARMRDMFIECVGDFTDCTVVDDRP